MTFRQRRRKPEGQVPETVGEIPTTVPIAPTGQPDVLYGCRFTAEQVRELAAGRVPDVVRRYFEDSARVRPYSDAGIVSSGCVCRSRAADAEKQGTAVSARRRHASD